MPLLTLPGEIGRRQSNQSKRQARGWTQGAFDFAASVQPVQPVQPTIRTYRTMPSLSVAAALDVPDMNLPARLDSLATLDGTNNDAHFLRPAKTREVGRRSASLDGQPGAI